MRYRSLFLTALLVIAGTSFADSDEATSLARSGNPCPIRTS